MLVLKRLIDQSVVLFDTPTGEKLGTITRVEDDKLGFEFSKHIGIWRAEIITDVSPITSLAFR